MVPETLIMAQIARVRMYPTGCVPYCIVGRRFLYVVCYSMIPRNSEWTRYTLLSILHVLQSKGSVLPLEPSEAFPCACERPIAVYPEWIPFTQIRS